MVLLCAFRIEAQSELFLPVEGVPRARERIVAITRTLSTTRDISGMRGDLVGDHSLSHIFGVWQSEMLFRRDVAQHVGSIPADHRRADRARDVVVAGRDVSDERTKSIEWRFIADFLHSADVHLYLVHRYMTRSLYHHLHVALPSPTCQLSQGVELGELSTIARIGDAPGTQAVAE